MFTLHLHKKCKYQENGRLSRVQCFIDLKIHETLSLNIYGIFNNIFSISEQQILNDFLNT